MRWKRGCSGKAEERWTQMRRVVCRIRAPILRTRRPHNNNARALVSYSTGEHDIKWVKLSAKSCSPASAAWRRITRQSGAGFSATVPNWRNGCAVISSQPTGPGVSMRPAFVSRGVGATSTEPSIPPAPQSTSCSRDCAMQEQGTPSGGASFAGRWKRGRKPAAPTCSHWAGGISI